MFFPLSSVPLSPFPVPCLTSYVSWLKCLFLVSHTLFPVSRLCSLFPVHCSLSHVTVPCLPSSVPCLTSLFLVSRPLSPILRSLFSSLCLQSSVPCFTSLFLVSRSQFPVSLFCSLFPALCSLSHVSVLCIPSSVPCLTSLFLVSRPLSPILRLCSSYPILLSRQFVVLYWFRVCSACDEIVSEYVQCAMKSFPRMLACDEFVPRMHSMRCNRFRICSACVWMSMRKKFECWLSIRENLLGVCSVCDEIVFSYAQCAIKSFPRMLSMRML
jgi:hypothetical protein